VTYSSTTCDLLGMRDAGEVRNKLNVSPAPKPPQPPKAAPGKAAATATQGGSAAAEAKDAKKEPERRCFKTAKGIRCNDKPEEDEK
jgi:ribosomal protein L12E/L44/L45/RPP1/RPP2